MNKLRLLVVDDDEDNRLVLRAICRKMDCFEIKDAVDGVEAVEMARSWHPHIILMDIMMPNMDGFEASKIIKNECPETVIIVVTAVLDRRIQDNMSLIGNDIYIHKPIDRELLRYKLASIGASLRIKEGNSNSLSTKIALNPFNSNIRSFKTFFEITNTEAMMDFGMWLYDHYNGKLTTASSKFDRVLEIFYMLMRRGNKNGNTMSIIIEESYEEFYITMKFDEEIVIEQKILDTLKEFETNIIVNNNIVCVSLSKPIKIKMDEKKYVLHVEESPKENIEIKEKVSESTEKKSEPIKEIRVIDSQEKELLKQSFVNKTSAADYVDEIGGDVLDEIRDLSSLDEEWIIKLRIIEEKSTSETLVDFADSVLNPYVKVINNLFEFTALAYALSSLSVFIKESAPVISQEDSKLKMFVMLLEHLGNDLTSWREHIFLLQDTADIHYLDSSFFSSCMQIEGIISNKDLDVDDDNDMEFF
ncbi:MAG: response regulator [Thiovulaceae bacterium]|nr:response regulator [Sulfurimonadaceae bacterium]